MSDFTPIRLGRGGLGVRRRLRRHRLALCGCLTVAALATGAAALPGEHRGGLRGAGGASAPSASTAESRAKAGSSRARPPAARRTVSAPVRFADAEAVRLLHPGDRIDVLAVGGRTERARTLAQCVRVADLPRSGDTVPGDGALAVLRVPRSTAAAMAKAAGNRLTVSLC